MKNETPNDAPLGRCASPRYYSCYEPARPRRWHVHPVETAVIIIIALLVLSFVAAPAIGLFGAVMTGLVAQ